MSTDIGWIEKMTAACSGSLLTSVVVNPFDVVRIRMQQDSAFAHANREGIPPPSGKFPAARTFNTTLLKNGPIPPGIGTVVCCRDVFWYPSTIDYCVASQLIDNCTLKDKKPPTTFGLINTIVRQEGPVALWRGLSLQLLQSIPSNVVYFVAYETMRDSSPIQSPILNPLLCGGAARMLATTVTSPIELFKTRLQSVKSANAFSIVSQSVRQMVRECGPSSLWSGLSLTLWRDVPFSMIYWLVVEQVRARVRAGQEKRTQRGAIAENVLAGTLGGLIASFFTTPFDVGKTRKQLGHQFTESATMRMIPFMAHIIQKEGWRALFVGMTPRMLKVAPACAIMITSYEMSKMAFSNRA